MTLTCVTINTTAPTVRAAICDCSDGSTTKCAFDVANQFIQCGVYSLQSHAGNALTVNSTGAITSPANYAALYVDCAATSAGTLDILVCNP